MSSVKLPRLLCPALLALVACAAPAAGPEPDDYEDASAVEPDARRPTPADGRSTAGDATPDGGPPGAGDDGGNDGGKNGGNDATADARGGDAGGDAPPLPDPAITAQLLGTVFDSKVLHEVEIVVEPKYLAMLDSDRVNRVPCTFTYDGTTIAEAGIRKKGSYGSYAALAQKPAFTIKMDSFKPGQKLHGLDKLALNNSRQDATLVAMHLGYELYRRAQLPAPLTAHAVVKFNGVVKGVYVVEEATDKDFLKRTFGKGNTEGNLYEGGYLGDVDFVNSPDKMQLKDEKEEMRSRADMTALAALVKNTASDRFAELVGAKLDLAGFMRGYIIDGLTNNWDGYAYNANNYYMYHRPSDDRFVFIPHGMDSLFRIDVIFGSRALLDVFSAAAPPSGECRACGVDGALARRLRGVPALDAAYRSELQRILREIWDVPALHARIDQVGALLKASAHTEAAFIADVKKFDMYVPMAKKFLTDRKTELLRPM